MAVHATRLTALATVLAMLFPAPSRADGCAPGLHMIAVRGTGEPPGAGVIGYVADGVANFIPGSKVVGLDYPAEQRDYPQSEGKGVEALRAAVDEYTAKCSDAKIAIWGYSQGAQVALDYICGGQGGMFNSSEPAPTSTVSNNIAAVILMGDPSHVANKPWNWGSSSNSGIFPRRDSATCDRFAAKLRSYCDKGDTFCDSGNNQAVHRGYWVTYRADAIAFVYKRFNESTNGVIPTASSTPVLPTASNTPAGPSSAPQPTPINPNSGLAALVPASLLVTLALGTVLLLV